MRDAVQCIHAQFFNNNKKFLMIVLRESRFTAKNKTKYHYAKKNMAPRDIKYVELTKF